jgi:hypothetical protein
MKLLLVILASLLTFGCKKKPEALPAMIICYPADGPQPFNIIAESSDTAKDCAAVISRNGGR